MAAHRVTEADWLRGDDLHAKIHHLGDQLSVRKARLFAVACGRRTSFGTTGALADVLDVVEQLADDPRGVTAARLKKTVRAATGGLPLRLTAAGDFAAHVAGFVQRSTSTRLMSAAAVIFAQIEGRIADEIRRVGVERLRDPTGLPGLMMPALRQYDPLLNDIAGNPFRPVPWQPAWQTADVVGVARGIYDDRAFDRLPLLADALQDAGCDNEQVLGHCRDSSPHVRGCWVVDLALGKS